MEESQIDNEQLLLFASVGMALTSWSGVEWALSRVFCQALDPRNFHPVGSNPVSARAFWEIESAHQKIKMTDSIAKESYFFGDFYSEWKKLRKRAFDANECRNKIAHGTIVKSNTGQKDGSVTKTIEFHPFYWQRHARMGRAFIPAAEKREKSLTSENLISESDKFKKLEKDLWAYIHKIFAHFCPDQDPNSFQIG